MKKLLLIFLVVMSLTGCHYATKNLGGSMTIELDPGYKLEEITWKGSDDLWILTRPMRDGEEAETHIFYQNSEWGMFEGSVTIVEKEAE